MEGDLNNYNTKEMGKNVNNNVNLGAEKQSIGCLLKR